MKESAVPALLELYARVTAAPHHKKLRMVPYFPTRLQLPPNGKVLAASAQQSTPLWKSDPGSTDSALDPARKKALSSSHGDRIASEIKGVRIAPLPVNLAHNIAADLDSETKQNSSSTSSPSHTPKSRESEVTTINSRSNSASKLDTSAVNSGEVGESETELAGSAYPLSSTSDRFYLPIPNPEPKQQSYPHLTANLNTTQPFY